MRKAGFSILFIAGNLQLGRDTVGRYLKQAEETKKDKADKKVAPLSADEIRRLRYFAQRAVHPGPCRNCHGAMFLWVDGAAAMASKADSNREGQAQRATTRTAWIAYQTTAICGPAPRAPCWR